MTPHASPHSPSAPTATRTRVKWDNIAIVLFGLVFAAFAAVAIMMSADSSPSSQTKAPGPESSHHAEHAPPLESTLTLEDAQGLVEEARSLMSEARWDEAADRIATIPGEHRAAVDADALQLQLDTIRQTHERLRAELDAAVEARQWTRAVTLLAELGEIAALDTSLLEIQAQVETALKPKAATPAAADKATPSATRGGGAGNATANATTRPAAKPAAQPSRPRPAAGTTRPAASGGGGATRPAASGATGGSTGGAATGGAATDGAATGDSTIPSLGSTIELTPAQQQELEAALAAALASAELQ